MFDSLAECYRDRLRWSIGVPVFALLPVATSTAFVESLEFLDRVMPKWRQNLSPRIIDAAWSVLAWPFIPAFWVVRRFDLTDDWILLLLLFELLLFGMITTWIIRRWQRQRYERVVRGTRAT